VGRGNFCPCGEFADQWYIDYDAYEWDDDEHEEYEIDYELLNEDIDILMDEICKRFPSFYREEKQMNHYWGQRQILENKFFVIGTADNEWSEAVFIQMKDDIWPCEQENLAIRHFESYCKGIREIMLDLFGTIYLRNGPWMSSKLMKEVS